MDLGYTRDMQGLHILQVIEDALLTGQIQETLDTDIIC
jgi:hypothetical protein